MKIGFIALKNILLGKQFINTWTSEKEINAYKRLYTCPNLGLLTVAGCTEDEHEMEYVDENFEEIDYGNHYDIVCLSPVAQQINSAYHVARRFRERQAIIIIGGIHATVLPEEVEAYADIVVVGEAEPVWNQILHDIENGCHQKRYYAGSKGESVNLEESPVPRYDLLKNKENYKLVSIQVTRGCPHDCEFCASAKLYGEMYRHKSVEQVINEILTIKGYWKRPFIYFTDDNMLVNRSFSKKLLKNIIPLKIRWFAFSDISIAGDDELLELLALSGCTQITFGLESLSIENLEHLNKNSWKRNQLRNYSDYLQKIQSYGIGAFGSFVVGLDNDTPAAFDDIEKFVLQNNLFGTSFTVLTPFPGTRLYRRLESENRIIDRNWDNYTCFNVVFKPAKMSVSELQEGFFGLYKNVYSEVVTQKRIKHFSQLIRDARNQYEFSAH